nr:NAD(P)/FAD-dependent oxidoreductase [Agreia bicolorata]
MIEILRPQAAAPVEGHVDCVIIGAGPAGMSAGLNLVRARRKVLLIDSNRPRHSATLKSHGFLTRDGVSPLELRKTGRAEFEAYPMASFQQALVTSVSVSDAAGPPAEQLRDRPEYRVQATAIRGGGSVDVTASAVLIASGLSETLPALPSVRAYYGSSLHSCVECDGFEKSDEPLALIGESDDLAERALLISQWSSDLIVFTNGVGTVSEADEAALAARGIRVERRAIADVVGDREGLTGVQLVDGEVIPRTGGFIRPLWETKLEYASSLEIPETADGWIEADADGRTAVAGIYAAGDVVPPGPHQLIVAAGEGARAAAVINRYLIGSL